MPTKRTSPARSQAEPKIEPIAPEANQPKTPPVEAETWNERYERERRQKVAQARPALARAAWELDDYDVIHVWEFLKIMEANECKSSTPIEDFIANLPSQWEYAQQSGRGLTPDDIVKMIEAPSDGVRGYFEDAVAITRDFNRRYAKTIAAKTEGEV